MGPDDKGLGAEDGGEHEGCASHLASTRVGGRLATAWIEDEVRYVRACDCDCAKGWGWWDRGMIDPGGHLGLYLVNQKANRASTWQKLFLHPKVLIV